MTLLDKSVIERNKPAAHVLLIVLLGLIVYSNTFHVPFVYDDLDSIVNNAVIRSTDNFFLNSKGYSYNPGRFIGYLTLALNYRLGGLSEPGYHLFNISVHVINAVLVYVLVILTFRTPFLKSSSVAQSSRSIALLAAALFVVHPVQTQAVTYIVQRLASLSTMFYLLAVIFVTKFRLAREAETPSGKQTFILYFLSLLMIILAMKTKEIAFTLPVVIVLYQLWFFRLKGRSELLFFVPILLTLLIIPLGMLHIDKPVGEVLSDVTEVTVVQTEMSRWDYLLTQFSVIITYIRLLVLPVGQNLDYDYPVYHSFFTPRVFISFFILLGLIVTAFVFLKRSSKGSVDPGFRLVSFGIFWFFITLTVESSVVPIRDVIYEHRVYLPSAGFFVAAATGVMLFKDSLNNVSARVAGYLVPAFGIIVLLLAVAAYSRNMVWQDSVRLWEDAVKKSPEKARPYNSLGFELRKRGFLEEAAGYYQKAIQLQPDDALAYHNLGVAYRKMGKTDEAFEYSRKALQMQPDFAEPHNTLGILYGEMGLAEQSIAEYQVAIQLKPDFAQAYTNLGTELWKKGLIDDAIAQYQIAATLRPDLPEPFNNLGIIYAQTGFFDKAITFFEQAMRLAPENPDFRRNRDDAVARKMKR